MREASMLCSILDGAAAVNDSERLWTISDRWRMRTGQPCKPGNEVALVWAHASDAAYWRAKAVTMRLTGRIQNATECEAQSEKALRKAAEYGTRWTRRHA